MSFPKNIDLLAVVYLKFKMPHLAYISREYPHANTLTVWDSDKHEIYVWVNSWVDMTRGSFHTLCAAHFQSCGVMAQFDVASGILITQYQLLLFHF